MNRRELREAAFYLAGYAVECGLKACIAKRVQRHDFPEKDAVNASYTHKLRKLVEVAGLEPSLQREIHVSSTFEANWAMVVLWSEQSRYERRGASHARDLINAIGQRRYGVLAWLRRRW